MFHPFLFPIQKNLYKGIMIASSSRSGARTGSAASNVSAGAMSDEQFRAAFEAVPDIRIDSFRTLVAEAQKHAAILENVNNDWTKRIKALQCLRSILKCDNDCYAVFAEQSYTILGTAFQLSVKDLRSQVCREACITLAYYCEKLGNGFWRIAETVLPTTINLTQNSAKVMATSGQICNYYIIKYIQHPKVFSIVLHQVSSKSKEIRRMTVSLIHTMINVWPASLLEKHFPEIIQSIKGSLSDADPEVRATARQTFESLQSLYPARADLLFQELEPSKQRILTGLSSTASSTHSINSERDNLPNPNRGLYNAQSAFLNKRSASDLNHTRRVNLATPKITYRPNVVRTTKPPPLSSNSPGVTDFYGLSNKQKAVLHRINSEENTNTARVVPAAGHVPQQQPKPTITAHHSSPITSKNEFHTPQKPKMAINNATENVLHGSGGGHLHRHHKPTTHANNLNDKKLVLSDGIENGQNKWSYLNPEMLANDTDQQIAFIQEICDTIGSTSTMKDREVEDALHVLTRIIRDGGITLWNEFFNSIFFAIQQIISHEADGHFNPIRICALKAMKELCLVQPKRLVAKTEMLLITILNAHECDDATVVRAAEDCGAAVATHLPTNTCTSILLTVIDDKHSKYHQLSGAIKMLSSVVSKLPAEEVERMLPTIVPRMTQCYENSQSMVRRSAIICLVSISHSIGLDILRPHLNSATLKLVEVYRDRMSSKRTDGTNP